MGPSFPPSVQFSRSVVSDSLRPHESQHARPPCPSPTPRVYPNPCPSSWWCHPAISSSVIPFSSCPQSFPALGWVNSSHEVAKVLDLRWSQNNSPHWWSLSHLFGLAIQDKIKDSVAIQVLSICQYSFSIYLVLMLCKALKKRNRQWKEQTELPTFNSSVWIMEILWVIIRLLALKLRKKKWEALSKVSNKKAWSNFCYSSLSGFHVDIK